MNATKIFLTTSLLWFFGGVVSAEPSVENGDCCGEPTAWDEFNDIEFRVSSSAGPGFGAWHLRFDKDSGDIQVDAEINDGSETLRGRVLMVGGRVLATHGSIAVAGAEIDALDAPMIERMLVTSLLGRSLPGGPAGIEGVRRIDFTEKESALSLATPSAGGSIPAPWRVEGEVDVVASDRVEFNLLLTDPSAERSSGKSAPSGQRLAGRLSKTTQARIVDTTSLSGWRLFGVGVNRREENGVTAIDYGAAPASTEYRSVAEIRKELAAEDFPGEPDPSKDFTGFWKTDCGDPFGLQIMPYGTDGKYSVVFCGPGGCGRPGKEGRSTFIVKDRHYAVVSESELKIRRGDDTWEVYHRCTKDTHPILRFEEDCDSPAPAAPSASDPKN